MTGKTKHIFVTGGVVSGLGKGITAASLGRLLKERGYRVTNQKFDPYLNVDPGTMSPLQHGEVFVTDDGAETDLDLGHYERFTDESLTINSSITSGKIYWEVLNRERRGDYGSATVQIIPHVTNEIKDRIKRVSDHVDIVITEIGGTVGDIESLPFLEAIRQYSLDVGHENCVFIHVTLIPYIIGSQELKSKPTQHSVKELQSLGIRPNVLVCRSEYPIPLDMRAKISMFCDVRPEDIIQNLTVDTIYGVPLMLEQEGLAAAVCHHLGLVDSRPGLEEWRAIVDQIKLSRDTVNIAIVGKYVELHDAYLSIIESLNHAGFTRRHRINCLWIDAEQVTAHTAADLLGEAQGILVPGGSGASGIEGKIEAVRYAREHGIPFFGICLGMQVAGIEFARNALSLAQANSTEFSENTSDPVFHTLYGDGETIRRGAYPCRLADGSVAKAAYGADEISERHCHRYEFNNAYREAFAAAGMVFSGLSPDGSLVEIMELADHPWFVGVQFHPEFKGRPNRPHPLFKGFVDAAIGHKTK